MQRQICGSAPFEALARVNSGRRASVAFDLAGRDTDRDQDCEPGDEPDPGVALQGGYDLLRHCPSPRSDTEWNGSNMVNFVTTCNKYMEHMDFFVNSLHGIAVNW